MTTLDLIGVTKDAKTAGPGKRLEIFTKGCIRGVINPCAGCFNEETWTFEGARRTFEVNELADIIERDAWNRQVTFCGGEPMIQAIALTALAKELKERDPSFHIVMYTAYKLDTLMKYGLKFTWLPKHGGGMKDLLLQHCRHCTIDYESEDSNVIKKINFTIVEPDNVFNLMKYVDIIVDGDYQADKRLTTDTYMHEGWFIGSSNQRVIFCDEMVLEGYLEKGTLAFLYADQYNNIVANQNSCKCCGHVHGTEGQDFCSLKCADRYKERIDFLNNEGITVKEGAY